MNDSTQRSPMPHSPYYSMSSGGVETTVRVGSYADYLERMEKWLLEEMQHVSGEEREDAEKALESVRHERQQLISAAKEQAEKERGEGQQQRRASAS